MPRRRPFFLFLSILGLFLFGTVVVLSSITYYLAIDPSAYLSELEVPILENHLRWNASEHGQIERIPRILHQTWRSEKLPQRWRSISQECRNMMPDYEYMLWTDESSRKFIAEEYPWFLDTYDDYEYNIQRADAIRYFVLHHYGGIYLDLDIGCIRPLDPLLVYPVILPKTIPVGVSNDLMFAQKGHPFLAQTIHNLVTFDHSWILNYPTVMFSTGPMFLSAQYGIFTSAHASTPDDFIRILPKSLYGKNAKDGEAPNAFFSHFYGSSWHADDAAFIGFLGHWGKGLLWIGLIILMAGLVMIALPGRQRRYTLRRIGGYDVLFPRWSQRTGHWHLHLPRSAMASSSSTSSSAPDDSIPGSPIDSDVPVLHLPFDMEPSSPEPSEMSFSTDSSMPSRSPILDTVRRVRNKVAALAGIASESSDYRRSHTHSRSRRQSHRRSRSGVLFFMPAIFAQPQDLELGGQSDVPMLSRPIVRRPSRHRLDRQRYTDRGGDLMDPSQQGQQPPRSERLIDLGEDDVNSTPLTRSDGKPQS
ncbi:mipc synthase subunit [Moniliophthora roreri]|uniref:Putative glycosyltransferase family 32 protein n=1 Tax=Moniliophthora roreri TaxID=221103 RepID=A0A0W0FK77_MONRR|nr:mipc synthase subunit [Moniliophthora roreri]